MPVRLYVEIELSRGGVSPNKLRTIHTMHVFLHVIVRLVFVFVRLDAKPIQCFCYSSYIPTQQTKLDAIITTITFKATCSLALLSS